MNATLVQSMRFGRRVPPVAALMLLLFMVTQPVVGRSLAYAGADSTGENATASVVPGVERANICLNCRYSNDHEWRFCVSCGKKMATVSVEKDPEDIAAILRHAAGAVFRVQSVVLVPARNSRKSKNPGEDDRIRMSLGSAVLVDRSGTVVTSTRSLMRESKKVELLSNNGEIRVALVVARDPATELAVLRIEPGNLAPLEPCDSDDILVIGERAWYIGYPMVTNPDDGTTKILPQSIKETVISGQKVGGLERLQIEDFIVFDAELNAATGGGALISSQGCLLGIGVEPGRTSVSLATAWNDTGRTVVAALNEGAPPARFYLGIGVRQVTDFERLKYGIVQEDGVLIDFIIPDSPASMADIREGDLLVQIGKWTVDDPTSLHREVPLMDNTPAILVLERSGKRVRVSLRPARRPQTIRIDILDEIEQWYGLGFRGVLYGGAKRTGMHITALRPGGEGEKYLEKGDILQKINQRWINDEASFRQMAGKNPGRVSMRFRRPSKGLFTLVYRRAYRTYRQPQVY